MKLFTSKQIREADVYTIQHEPIASVDLMERAAKQLFGWMVPRFSPQLLYIFFVGPGNNGGDGWALARMLWQEGYRNIEFYVLKIGNTISPDSEINRTRLNEETEIKPVYIESEKDFPKVAVGDIIVDALFGSGLSRSLESTAAQLVMHINRTGATIISVDLPSGLFSENNEGNSTQSIIHATYTLSFQFPKLAFFFAENEHYVGEWHLLNIGLHPHYIKHTCTNNFFISETDIVRVLRKRKKFSHKGAYGHGLLIAGSYGMMGAAVLAARAGICSGLGLLTSHIPRLGVDVLQTAVPESLLSIDESDYIFTEHTNLVKYSALAVGPGLNTKSNTRKGLLLLLREVTVPIVIDADALNILAEDSNWPQLLPENAILTPHPKEFERLFGTFKGGNSRLEAQRKFSEKNNCIIVLKGAHTCITTPNGDAYFNSTGNPGMARGGSGDVLTGIILGLLSQKYSPSEAAIMGVYIHGMAGDLSANEKGQYGMVPTDMINNIGRVFYVLENKESDI